jgi:hypothetical protein
MPPVARTSFEYAISFPEAVLIDLLLKSMLVTSSEMESIDSDEYQDSGLMSILFESGISAFESFVRSMGKLGSFETIVIRPL